jgi:hypothetical protein
MTSPTLQVISEVVGVGGAVSGPDTRRILQLLSRAGFLGASASKTEWSKAATRACQDFYQYLSAPPLTAFDPDSNDGAIVELCKKADVVLPLQADSRGRDAFFAFFDEARRRKIRYNWSNLSGQSDRLAFGLCGHPELVIFTLTGGEAMFDPNPQVPGVLMNCTSFVNLGMSIWQTGCAHERPYDPDQSPGGFNPISSRYGLPSIYNVNGPSAPLRPKDLCGYPDFSVDTDTPSGVSLLERSQPRWHVAARRGSQAKRVENYYFYDSDDILKIAKNGSLYYLEWCYLDQTNGKDAKVYPAGFGHHDTLLLDGMVYEINITNPSLACTPLGKRMNQDLVSRRNALRLFGPV